MKNLFKFVFFSIITSHVCLAEDLQWKNQSKYDPSYPEQFREANFNLDDNYNYVPQKNFTSKDRLLFSNGAPLNIIHCSQIKNAQHHLGGMHFQGKKEFCVKISNYNNLSLYNESCIINEGCKVAFHVDEGSTLNLLGLLGNHQTGSSPVAFKIENGSHLNFSGNASGNNAIVCLHNHSKLTISTHNRENAFSVLTDDATTTIEINDSFLTLGNSGGSDSINGTLKGTKPSLLFKRGGGTLNLNGNCQDFEGTIVVNEGKVILKKDLGGNVDVFGFPKASFEFHDHASAGANHIHVNQGSLLFKGNSDAASSHIHVANGEVAFQDKANGNSASLHLLQNSKLTINQNNSFGAMNADASSSIVLNKHALKIGSLDQDCALAGEIIGKDSSQLIKEGSGKLHVFGKNPFFEGNTFVNSGSLIFRDGHLGGEFFVNKGALLGGTGSIGKNLLNDEGIIELSENDTLIVGNNLIQSGELRVNVNKKGQNSKILIGGKGVLKDGSLKVGGDFRLCFPYVVMEGGELEGFDSENAKYTGELPSTVEFMAVQGHADNKDNITLRFVPNLLREGYNSNQKNIAEQFKKINQLSNDDHEDAIHALIDLDEKSISKALDQLSGSQYANLLLASERNTQQFIRRIYTPLRAISIDHDCEELCMNNWITWADVEAGKTFQNGSHGFDSLEYSVTAAIQKSMNDWLTESCPLAGLIPCNWLTGWTAGLAGSYAYQNYDFKQGGDAHLHDIKGGFYTLLTKSLCYVVMDFILGGTTGKAERSIKCGRIHEKAHGNIDLFQACFYGELGLNNIFCCNFRLQPFVGIETGYYRLGGFKEHGTCFFDLEIKDHSDCLTTSYLGVHLFNFLNDDCAWGFSADLIWKHLFDYDNHLNEKFVHFGDKFKICGHHKGVNGIEGTLTYFHKLNHFWVINAELTGERWEDFANFYLSAGCSYKW